MRALHVSPAVCCLSADGVQSSQVYLYSAIHNIDCIKAASQYQSEHNNNVRFLVGKHPRLVELIKGITDWVINLNKPD